METFSALLAICAGNSPVPGEFPTQSPVTRSFDVFLDLRPNKRSSKQWWGWWFETLSRPLWRHRNGNETVSSLASSIHYWAQRDLFHIISWLAMTQFLTYTSLSAEHWSRPGDVYIYIYIYIYMYVHYNDVIMGAIASQIISLTIVYSTVYSDADQGKHQSSASLAFVRKIHRWTVNSPHKWPVTRKMFPFDDVIMNGLDSGLLPDWRQAITWTSVDLLSLETPALQRNWNLSTGFKSQNCLL